MPWTEESGRLQSLGSQRVGHDWETFTHFHIFFFFYYCGFFTLNTAVPYLLLFFIYCYLFIAFIYCYSLLLFFSLLLLSFAFCLFSFSLACRGLTLKLRVGLGLLWYGYWVQSTGLTENFRSQRILISVRSPGHLHLGTKTNRWKDIAC